MKYSEEELRQKIIELIDKHTNSWVMAAFYSDPEVDKIMKNLLKLWQENGEQGKPIDYASGKELEILYLKAKSYAFMNENTARALAMSRMVVDEEEKESALGVFRKLFSRGRREASP